MKVTRLILFGMMSIIISSCINNEDPNKQTNQEIAQIDQYLQNLGVAEDVLYDNNYGFRFLVGQYGEYPPPHQGQKVTVHYIGRLFPSETVFDSGTKEGDLQEITPLVLGYSAQNLMTNSQARIYVPSKYGYGEEGNSTLGVPPNAILIYDVWVEKTERTALEQSRFETDSTSIANYLEANQISATYNPGGIWYTVTEPGTGDYPNVYNSITCQYSLKLLSNPGTNIETGTLTQTNIFGLIDGFKVAMPLFNEGTKATFYIPSGLGYGPNGTSSVPANSNLIYDITLTTVH
ncbi:MAG TPA: FKBP-type peptidyl-prolyl cis-trans isomerase [Cyclobacteriaceae bacterium]|nr:FKBP-type peptidyl-prolyl cis-trans isomerase [Cyclobacteriaceae bacterium]